MPPMEKKTMPQKSIFRNHPSSGQFDQTRHDHTTHSKILDDIPFILHYIIYIIYVLCVAAATIRRLMFFQSYIHVEIETKIYHKYIIEVG